MQTTDPSIDPILAAMSIGVAVVRPDGKVTLANAAFTALFGKRKLTGTFLRDLVTDVIVGCPDADCQRLLDLLTTAHPGLMKAVTTMGNGKTIEWQRQALQADQPFAGFLVTAYDITEIEQRIVQLTRASEVDALTGLANRRKFDDAFQKVLEQALRTGQQGALLLFDLDRFKTVNDRFGHAQGDAVLKQVSVAVEPLIRHYELIARVGGDEFGILISHDGARAVSRLLTQLPKALRAITHGAQGLEEPLEISMGYGFFPDQGHSVTTIFDTADRMLYGHKALKKGSDEG
jgi:diguanylate cyclase (GGDEF)-like protein